VQLEKGLSDLHSIKRREKGFIKDGLKTKKHHFNADT
jgi:hypothetical protein